MTSDEQIASGLFDRKHISVEYTNKVFKFADEVDTDDKLPEDAVYITNPRFARTKLICKRIYRFFRYFPNYRRWDVSAKQKEFSL